jgi:hypothetical protein
VVPETPPALPTPLRAEHEAPQGGEWGSLFDQADAAVLLDLQAPPPDEG